MKYRIVIYISLILLLIFNLQFCAPLPCTQETVATVKAFFYRTGTGNPIVADTVTLYGIGRDTSKIYDRQTGLSSINFPLDAGSDSCSFFLQLNMLADTVTFYYSDFPHLVSKECGYTYYYILTSITHKKPVLDYIIQNQTITTVNEENVRIFY